MYILRFHLPACAQLLEYKKFYIKILFPLFFEYILISVDKRARTLKILIS